MILQPFVSVSDIPNGLGSYVSVSKSDEFIDVADRMSFELIKAINKPYFRGICCYLFNAELKTGFGNRYNIVDLEVRAPFNCCEGKGLIVNGVNLIHNNLASAQSTLNRAGIVTVPTDVGFQALSIGVSFFSSNFTSDLNCQVDAITIHFNDMP